MNNDQQVTYLDLLESTADVLTNIKEGASTDQFNALYAEVALRCVEEKIAEVDSVLTKMQRQEEMQSNLDYLIKKMESLEATTNRVLRRLENA